MVQYLNVAAAAKRFGVTERLIYKEITEGRLPAIRLGDPGSKRPVIRIPVEALDLWEARQLIGGK